MNQHTLQQDIDLWEAWIEFDAIAPHHFGTLYIMGEVLVNHKSDHPFIIKCVQDDEPHTLHLKVLTSPTAAQERVAEVVYSEPLQHPGQYSSIRIFSEDELIAHIEDIEVMI
ncbi:MAG: hypothetical protein ACXVMS_09365 [Flavisolibacter sp.]